MTPEQIASTDYLKDRRFHVIVDEIMHAVYDDPVRVVTQSAKHGIPGTFANLIDANGRYMLAERILRRLDAELRARDERIIRATIGYDRAGDPFHLGWSRDYVPGDYDAIIAAAEADQ